jgi:hypothetical protein
MVVNMNLNEAIDLLDVASDFNFESSEKKPNISIYDNQNEGFVLFVKANLVNEKYRDYLKEIVESRRLGMRESEGYLIIYGP